MAPESDSLCLLGVGSGVVTQFSLIMYTIIIQMCVPPMYQELEQRSPQKFRTCLFVAFAVLYLLFSAVMISGYVAFGPQVQASILDNLPNDAWGMLARLGMAVCVLGCYPLNMKPIVAPFLRGETSGAAEPLLAEGKVAESDGRTILFTSLVVLLVTLASLCISSLGPLNALNGAIGVTAFIGVIPGMTGLHLLSDVGQTQRLCLYTLVVLSVLASVLGLVATDNNHEELMAACILGMPWH